MDEIYENVDGSVPGPRQQWGALVSGGCGRREGSRSEGTCRRAALLSLLLNAVLLAGLVGLGVHYHSSAELAANLTDLLQASNKKLSSVSEERDQLKADLSQTTEERGSMHRQGETCPEGWTESQSSCYHLSSQSDSWAKAREACRQRGADLVVVDSSEEQTFLAEFTKSAVWIGLSDLEDEGTWKWVDGTSPTVRYWAEQQPDNWNEEDCVHMRSGKESKENWNDVSCDASLGWICEKDSNHGY